MRAVCISYHRTESRAVRSSVNGRLRERLAGRSPRAGPHGAEVLVGPVRAEHRARGLVAHHRARARRGEAGGGGGVQCHSMFFFLNFSLYPKIFVLRAICCVKIFRPSGDLFGFNFIVLNTEFKRILGN